MPDFAPASLLAPNYWLEPQPGPPSLAGQLVDMFFLLVMLGGFILVNYANRRLETHPFKFGLLRRLGQVLIFYSAAVVLVYTFRYLGIPYLGSRLPLLAIGLAGIGLIIYGAFYYFQIYPRRLAEAERQLAIDRYKPEPKSERRRRRKKKKKRR